MKNRRVIVYMNDALRDRLKATAAASDASVGEICRRFLRLGLFADRQSDLRRTKEADTGYIRNDQLQVLLKSDGDTR